MKKWILFLPRDGYYVPMRERDCCGISSISTEYDMKVRELRWCTRPTHMGEQRWVANKKKPISFDHMHGGPHPPPPCSCVLHPYMTVLMEFSNCGTVHTWPHTQHVKHNKAITCCNYGYFLRKRSIYFSKCRGFRNKP